MVLYMVFTSLVMSCVGLYGYHYLAKTFPAAPRWVMAGIAVLVTLPGLSVWSFWAVVLFHLALFSLVVELCFHRAGLWKVRLFVPVAATVLVLCYGWWNMRQVRMTTYHIRSDKVSEAVRIAMIGDLHYPETMDGKRLKDYLDDIQTQEPDIFVLVGDIIGENTDSAEMEQAASLLGSVRVRLGRYYVFGNHDKANYARKKPYSVDAWVSALERHGITVLEDQMAELDGTVSVTGRKDRSEQRLGSDALPKGEGYRILLDHQPVGLDENARAGFDLELSGHTHAGQIFPLGLLNRLSGMYKVNYGLKQIGGMELIVTSGLGGWGYPVRTGGHSEYVIIDVTP